MSSMIAHRVMTAIRGAFVADAASMGTHWIYDPLEMATTVASLETPEFRTPPAPRFYSAEEFPGHYMGGMLSPYGEQLLFVTEHLATSEDLTGEGMSQDMLKWANSFGGRPDSALKQFVENMNGDKPWPLCGADDHQAHIYMKLVPVVGRYAGAQDLVDKVTTAIQVHQNNPTALAFGIASARLLEAVILGAPLEEALETTLSNIAEDLEKAGLTQEVKDQVLKAYTDGKTYGHLPDTTLDSILLDVSHQIMAGKEDTPFYNLAGRSCALPGSFVGPIAIFYKYAPQAATAFAPALRENILASGDTCSRAVFIAAVLAAAATKEDTDSSAIPSDWLDKMDTETMKKIDAAVESIVKQRK